MSSDTLEQLQQLDITLLIDVVRQDQRSPAFEILNWTVKPLSHEKIISTTGGLYLFSGQGNNGHKTQSWSIVLKILHNPKESCVTPHEWCYWKREMLAFGSGLLAGMPRGIGSPRCYGVSEYEDGAWIWLEHIIDSTEWIWGLEQFQQAARQAGHFGGAFLNGAPLFDHPWFTSFFRSNLGDGGPADLMINPESPQSVWQDRLVQESFAEPLRTKVLQVWRDREMFFNALDRLPQVFCHNDLHRRNLLLRPRADGQPELIAVDWAFCGIGAVGTDLGELIANSSKFFNSHPKGVPELEKVALEAYVAGLRDGGWSGDPRLPRLGYLLAAALFMGITLPIWTRFMLSDDSDVDVMAMYKHPAAEVLAGWVSLSEFLMERADEARHLVGELGLG